MDKYFDSHTHYDDEKFDKDRDEIISRIFQDSVWGIINCAGDIATSLSTLEMAEKYEGIYAAVGIHPHESGKDRDNIEKIIPLLSQKKVLAVGEIGLDYHYDFSPRDIQREVFEKQLELSLQFDMPVIIHMREATKDTLEILKEYKPRGVVHCFSSSLQTAEEIMKIGMYFGIGGAVTFKNARKPVEALREIPMDRILLETDCPYMTPVPHRGERNNSSYISFVIDKISEIKGIEKEKIIDITNENAKRLFNI